MQFVKWDCRSGNAGVDRTGELGWFDFEYCGRRHGAEDTGLLIADEAWPIDLALMLHIVKKTFPSDELRSLEESLDFLCLYIPFHAMWRLALIIKKVKSRGWRSKARILERDDVGHHPQFAINLSVKGA